MAPGRYEVAAVKDGIQLASTTGQSSKRVVIKPETLDMAFADFLPPTHTTSDMGILMLQLPDGRSMIATGSRSEVFSRGLKFRPRIPCKAMNCNRLSPQKQAELRKRFGKFRKHRISNANRIMQERAKAQVRKSPHTGKPLWGTLVQNRI